MSSFRNVGFSALVNVIALKHFGEMKAISNHDSKIKTYYLIVFKFKNDG